VHDLVNNTQYNLKDGRSESMNRRKDVF